jgi:tetratricopeptide (TPR) repeat protein
MLARREDAVMSALKLSSAMGALAASFLFISMPGQLAFASGGGGGMSGGGMSATPAPSGQDPVQAYQAGVAAMQAHNYREAIRQFRITQRAAPHDGPVNYALGLAYAGNNDNRGAKDCFQRAVRADNAPVGAYLELAQVSLALGDRDTAVAQQTAVQNLLNACDTACGDARRAQLQAAYDAITTALAPAPAAAQPPAADPATTGWNFPSVEQGRLAYAEAVGDINQHRYEAALQALGRAQAAVGPHPDILNYMGFASRKLGRFDDAFAYYRAALRIDPNHLGANEYLGELYLQLGDLPQARRQLARLDQLCAYGCAQHEELARWIQLASN